MDRGMEQGETKRGRPKKEIDYALVRRYAQAQCTQEMIASALHLSLAKCTGDPEFVEAFHEGKEEGKNLLLQAQMKSALNGNAQMQIWLGKQHLRQSDKIDTTNDTRVTIIIAGDDKDL